MSRLIETALAHAWPIQWYDELGSTNVEAKRRAESGDLGPIWICARSQTEGKGRLGRTWVSPTGNLATSVLLPFDAPVGLISKLSFATALAILDAVKASGFPSQNLKLKWPNDVRLDGQKLSGILIESGQASRDVNWVVVGIGVNIQSAPNLDQQTICLSDLSPKTNINADMFLEHLTLAFSNRLHSLIKFGFEPIREDWLFCCEGLNKEIMVKDGQLVHEGRMRGIDEFGALLLEKPDGLTIKITTGDVNLLS